MSGAHWGEASGEVDPATGYWRVSPMRTDLPTLADKFGDAGYRTVALSANSLLDPELGLLLKDQSYVLCARRCH